MKNILYDKSFWRVFFKKVKKIHFLHLFPSYKGCRRVVFGAVKQYRQQAHIK